MKAALAVAVWMLVLVPLKVAHAEAAACGIFDDVSEASPFCASIAYLANRRVTLGCGEGLFCPKGSTTREQAAALVERAIRVATPIIRSSEAISWKEAPRFTMGSVWCETDAEKPVPYDRLVTVRAAVNLSTDPSPMEWAVEDSWNGGPWSRTSLDEKLLASVGMPGTSEKLVIVPAGNQVRFRVLMLPNMGAASGICRVMTTTTNAWW